MAKGCALSTGYLPRGGLPRNSVDRITDRPDMTSAVDRGRKASTQTNKKTNFLLIPNRLIRLIKCKTYVPQKYINFGYVNLHGVHGNPLCFVFF